MPVYFASGASGCSRMPLLDSFMLLLEVVGVTPPCAVCPGTSSTPLTGALLGAEIMRRVCRLLRSHTRTVPSSDPVTAAAPQATTAAAADGAV